MYGAALQNWFICVPNAMGACLGGTSCLLCLVFPRIPTEEGAKVLERRLTRIQNETLMLQRKLKRVEQATKGKDRHRVAAQRTQWAQEAVAEWEEEAAEEAEWERELAAAKARDTPDDSAADEAGDVEAGGAAAPNSRANGSASDRTSPARTSDAGGGDGEQWHDAV